jgi:hypothetical protein
MKNEVLKNEGNQWIFERKYSSKNKYTPFDILTNTKPIKEYYAMDIPRYIHITYDIICWTEFLEQMNELVEQIMFFNGTAFGDTQKFPTMISAPSFELSNDIGSDRFVKAKFQFTTKAYLINEDARNRPTIQKLIPANKVVVNFTEISPSIQDVKLQNTVYVPPPKQQVDILNIVYALKVRAESDGGIYEGFDTNFNFIQSLVNIDVE